MFIYLFKIYIYIYIYIFLFGIGWERAKRATRGEVAVINERTAIQTMMVRVGWGEKGDKKNGAVGNW
jgi:hypothetical protein